MARARFGGCGKGNRRKDVGAGGGQVVKTLDVFRSPRCIQQDVGLKEKSRSDGHISLGNVLLAVKQVSLLQDFSESFFK